MSAAAPMIMNWGQVLVIVLGLVLGFYFQSRDIAHLGRRIDDLRDSLRAEMNARFAEVNSRFESQRDFIHSEVSRLEDRLDRLEHPIVRP